MSCPDTQIACDGQCVDASTNTNHCGSCNNTCGDSEVCQSGQCTCRQDQTECDGECADLSSDADHCGSCGNACDGEFGACSGGECGCGAGLTLDSDSGECIDTANDPLNCGSLGNECGERESCQGGSCECREGLTDCNGTCVDTESHPDHCGACGEACGTVDNTCFEGECQLGCGPGAGGGGNAEECDPDSQQCVAENDMQSNDLHCGECNEVCSADEICSAGDCESYRIGRDCSQCPCPDCGGDNCCPKPGTSGAVICVDGPCP